MCTYLRTIDAETKKKKKKKQFLQGSISAFTLPPVPILRFGGNSKRVDECSSMCVGRILDFQKGGHLGKRGEMG